MEPILKCEYVSKIYGQNENKAVRALYNCNIAVQKGTFTAIIGKSGSGKSTLLNVMATFDRPTAGRVFIKGEDVFNMKEAALADFRNARIGFIFQHFNLLPILTAKENILMPRIVSKDSHSKYYFDELVERLNLTDRLDHLPGELSGGQQQRVAVARSLINSPEIVFADEPTGNLDSESSAELIEMLFDLRARFNQTLVMVTHDMEIAQKADTIYRIEDGILNKF